MSCILQAHFFVEWGKIKGGKIVCRGLGAADQLVGAILAQQHFGAAQLAVVVISHGMSVSTSIMDEEVIALVNLRKFAVNSEYITGVAAFSNRTDSGTLIPFLNHIQRMQSRSYRDIVADAGYESVRNYLYLEQNGQNCFIKPISYEKQKTKKFKSQFWRAENMEPLEHEDGFLCAGGRKLLFTHSSSKKENGFVTTTDYYRCKDCSGCELRSKCFKSSDGMKNKEIRMCTESAEHRKIAFENLLSERGALLRINRSIQVEGAFGVLKSNRKFKRFLMRGKTNISTELFLLCLAFDLQKFFSKLQRGKRNSHLFPLKKE